MPIFLEDGYAATRFVFNTTVAPPPAKTGCFLKDFFQDLVRTFQDFLENTHIHRQWGFLGSFLGAGFKYFLFSPLLGKGFHFD